MLRYHKISLQIRYVTGIEPPAIPETAGAHVVRALQFGSFMLQPTTSFILEILGPCGIFWGLLTFEVM